MLRQFLAQNESAHNPAVSRDGATSEIFLVNNSIDYLGAKLGEFPFNIIALVSLNVGLALLIGYCVQPICRTLESGISIAQDRNITTDLDATRR